MEPLIMEEGRQESLERWYIVSRNASGSCLSSTSGLVVLVAVLSVGGLGGSLLAGPVGAVIGALAVVTLPVYACLRIKAERIGSEIRVTNRFRSFRIPLDEVVELSTRFLDRDPKSPPVLAISFSHGGIEKQVQVDVTASSSAEERAEIAAKFRSSGLKPGAERRYVEW